jgi:hypothetical protein
MMVVGVLAFGYGLQSGSPVLIVEGFFLVWLATKLTISMMNDQP